MRVICCWLLASTTSAFLLRGGPCITNTAMSVFRGGIADGDPARLERDALTRRFLAAFGDDANPVVVAFAPGRANLIGEHTDYQDGLVMPFALDVGVYVAFRARSDDALNVFAEDFNAWGATTLGAVRAARAADPAYGPAMDPKWLRYVAAPFDWLRFGADGSGRCARGCDALVASDVPVGGGVSSSSALTVAFALVARHLHRSEALRPRADGKSAFLLATCEAEWHFSGLKGGIMDQTASLYGRPNMVFPIDCRRGELSDLGDGSSSPYVPADGAAFVVLNTMVAHSLPDSPYAKRRESCERVAALLAANRPGWTHLRDASDLGTDAAVSLVDGLEASGRCSAEDARRARHGVAENNRVRAAAAALRARDWAALGSLMSEAHASLRDLYAVSCDELDVACDIAEALEGCHGARMMGGGFGGCVIALCDPAAADVVAAELRARYKARTADKAPGGIDATVFVTTPGAGASLHFPGDAAPVRATDDAALWRTA